jgi:septum site-determining protein MinD
MVSIAVCSGKGGTGKTTVTANLAVAMAQFGRDVLVVDADIEMANLCFHLRVDGSTPTLHDVLAGRAELAEAVREAHGVKVLPGAISLKALKHADPERLEEVLSALEKHEIVLIDAPAGLGRALLAALSVVDAALLVVNPEVSSLGDALKTKVVAGKLKVKTLGAVLNRWHGTPEEIPARDVETVLEMPVLATIPEDKKVREASSYGTPLVLHSPQSPAAQALKELAANLLGEEYRPVRRDSFVSRLKKLFIK